MRIAVVSPHPDDETLGAGGSIFKLKDEGNEIYWVNVTDANSGGGIVKRLRRNADARLAVWWIALIFPDL